MFVSEEVRYFHNGDLLTRRGNDDVEDGNVNDSLEGAIPLRYQDGSQGINLEHVRQDQRQARRQVIRAMIRRLGELLAPNGRPK